MCGSLMNSYLNSYYLQTVIIIERFKIDVNIQINQQNEYLAIIQLRMKSYFLVTLLFLSQITNTSKSTKQQTHLDSTAQSLPYQAHSFNNLDITRNLLLKKVKYFKFDASLANKHSCQTFSTWNNKNSCINTTEYAQDMCCIAMRGDTGSQPNFNSPFNTSYQFTSLIDTFLAQHHANIDILFIAIDFQFGFSFKNTLAEQFMYDLATLMNKYPKVHVTTKGEYIFQFDRVCKGKLFFTTDNLCTKERKYISNSRFFLQSGSMNPYDSRDYKGRFQNFNTIYKEIDHLCQNGFPTWMNKYPNFPLIFWEPSNERQIQESMRKLMDPSCKSKHNRSWSGIAFASNINPQMFQIGMKQTNLNSSQFPWSFDTTKLWLQNAAAVKIAKIVDQTQTERLVLYKKVISNDTTNHFLNILSVPKGQQSASIQITLKIQSQIIELRGVKNTIIAVFKSPSEMTQSRDYSANIVAYNSKLEKVGELQVNGYISSYSDQSFLYYISLTSNPQVFNIYIVNQTLKNPTQYKVSVFLPKQQIQSITSIYFSKRQKAEDDVLLILGNNLNKTWIAEIQHSQQHKIKDLTFGTGAKIIAKDPSNVVILLQNSYTHGGMLINNGADQTCMYHKVKTQKPLATVPYLVNAVESSLENLQNFIENDSDQIVTACHPKISFSKFFNGADLQAVSIWNRLFISTKMIPIHKQSIITTIFSGGSNFQPSLKNKNGYLITTISTRAPYSDKYKNAHIVEQ